MNTFASLRLTPATEANGSEWKRCKRMDANGSNHEERVGLHANSLLLRPETGMKIDKHVCIIISHRGQVRHGCEGEHLHLVALLRGPVQQPGAVHHLKGA
jgi:hypothetical protein